MLKWSLRLDWILVVRVQGIPFLQKFSFVLLKYLIFIKNNLFGWTDGVSFAIVFGERFYYNEPYGIASLQRVYCEHHQLREFIPVGAMVIDVGANIGQFNFFSRHYLKASRVISIEPLPGCFAILAKNASVSDDCHQLALSDRNGVRTMFLSSISSSLSSYIPASGASMIADNAVISRTLDDFVTDLGVAHVDLLKVDTEGSEYDIIRGGSHTLTVCTRIAIEMSVSRPSSGDVFRIGNAIENAGFRLLLLAPHSGYRPSAVDGLFEKSDQRGD